MASYYSILKLPEAFQSWRLARTQIGHRHPTKQNLLRGVTVADFAYYTRPGPRTARTIISVGSNTRYHEIYTGSKPVWAFGSHRESQFQFAEAGHRISLYFIEILTLFHIFHMKCWDYGHNPTLLLDYRQ